MTLKHALQFDRGGQLAAMVSALVILLAGCGGESDTKAAPERPEIPTIEAATLVVESSVFPDLVRTQGSLVADEVTVVGARVAGRVAEVHVDVGDAVAAGAPLATLDRAEFQLAVMLAQAQLVQARAALGMSDNDPLEQLVPQNAPPVREAQAIWDEARTRTERLQRLLPRNAATQEEVDASIAAERVAEARRASAVNGVLEKIAQIRVRSAELAVAQQRLDDAIVLAPFDAQIQERHVAPGAFVQLGQSVATLVRTSTLRFRGTMPERHAPRMALGQEVVLTIESVAGPIRAKVTRISPVVEERSRSLMFEVVVPNADGQLRTGLFTEAEVIVDPLAKSLVIPPSALVEFAGAEKVWKVVDGMVHEQVVETARRSERGVEVTSGLSAGDVILPDASQGRVARIAPVPPGVATQLPSTDHETSAAASGSDDSLSDSAPAESADSPTTAQSQ